MPHMTCMHTPVSCNMLYVHLCPNDFEHEGSQGRLMTEAIAAKVLMVV